MARERPTILDDDEPPLPKRTAELREKPRHGFEWGLASTLLGMSLLLAGTGGIIVCILLWFGGSSTSGRGIDLNLAQIAGVVMGIGAIVFSIFGFFFGIRGLGQARQAGQPAALPLAGIFLCIAAFLLWIIVTVDFLMIIESFTRWRDY